MILWGGIWVNKKLFQRDGGMSMGMERWGGFKAILLSHTDKEK